MQQRVQINPGQTIYKYVLQQSIGGGGLGMYGWPTTGPFPGMLQ